MKNLLISPNALPEVNNFLLKEESYFDKVVDPAAGSYYIENLTDLIAKNSWELFKVVEEIRRICKSNLILLKKKLKKITFAKVLI